MPLGVATIVDLSAAAQWARIRVDLPVPALTAHISSTLTRCGLSAVEVARIAGFASPGGNPIFVRDSPRRALRLV